MKVTTPQIALMARLPPTYPVTALADCLRRFRTSGGVARGRALPSVEITLFAQDQEEGERQDGYQRGDEPGSANDHISGGQKEVTGCPPSWLRISSIWWLNLSNTQPSWYCLARPLRYSVGPSGACATAATNLIRPWIWSISTGNRIPSYKSNATTSPR